MPSKVFKSLTMLHVIRLAAAYGSISVPVAFVLKAAGNMQWLAQNFRHGRLHTPALWLAAERLRCRLSRTVADCPGLQTACEWWARTAAGGRLQPHRFIRALDIPSLSMVFDSEALTRGAEAVPGLATALPRDQHSRPVVAVLTDVSGGPDGAMGGCWRVPGESVTRAFYAPLSDSERAWPAICAKELLAVVTWLENFGGSFRGAVILFGTDNAGNVFAVNRISVAADDTVMAELMGRLMAAADACVLPGNGAYFSTHSLLVSWLNKQRSSSQVVS